ncbi:MAG: peptidoglycan editing factor PgeF [Anaerolineae bacterium]|nr:peptidoglycan editing factor PgeF [Anaerolineae bacterium]
MPFQKSEKVSYYIFEIFAKEPVVQAVFTRNGGVSSSPWAELNVGSTVGDEMVNVSENLRRSFSALGRDPQTMYDSWLVHGTDVLIAEHPADGPRDESRKADILLTNKPGVTLFMRYADCVPVFLYDPENSVVGLVHAGWRGTIKRAAGNAVAAMTSHFCSSPASIRAAIGPSICQDHYEIGPDVANQVGMEFGEAAADFLLRDNGSLYFDLRQANQATLRQSGVVQIEDADICTACNLETWFSHRGEAGRTGRFGAMFGLADE